MNRKHKTAVLGGDLRQITLAELMLADGLDVSVFALGDTSSQLEEAVKNADSIILPMPYSIDGIRLNCPLCNSISPKIDELFKMFKPAQFIAGGKFDRYAQSLASDNALILHDYYTREELCIANAIPTAEGAISIAMTELQVTIHGLNTLVLGFGRIGKILAKTLYALGADVTVAVRKQSDAAWIDSIGCSAADITALDSPECRIHDYKCIFNTVPHMILSRDILSLLDSEALVIDLASNPGGVDFNAAKELGVNAIWALSLPGKTAPATSGKIIKNAVVNMLREDGRL